MKTPKKVQSTVDEFDTYLGRMLELGRNPSRIGIGRDVERLCEQCRLQIEKQGPNQRSPREVQALAERRWRGYPLVVVGE